MKRRKKKKHFVCHTLQQWNELGRTNFHPRPRVDSHQHFIMTSEGLIFAIFKSHQ